MSRDSGGTYTRVDNSFSNPISGTAIDPSNAISLFDDIETEVTDSLCRSGKGSMLADLSMGGFAITTATSVQFKGSSSGFTVIKAAAAASGTVTLPAATDTLVGKATTDTLTNKTFDTAGTGNSFSVNGTAITAKTGSGNTVVLQTGATLSGPNIGSATGQGLLVSSNSIGIGYSTGAGGTVTQSTNKTTGVTLNTITGQITMNNASLASGSVISFTMTNSSVALGDTIIVNHASAGTYGSYIIQGQCASGSAVISVRNPTGGALAEAIVLQFTIIKSVTS